MTDLPIVYVVRHGDTAWSLTGQHTRLTDLPLTETGEQNACKLADRLNPLTFILVLTSPLQRAARTCALAGFGAVARIDCDLVEWNYGDFEGLRTAEIRKRHPDWQLFRDGCPGGESPQDVAARADRIISRIRAVQGNVLLVLKRALHSCAGEPLDQNRAIDSRRVFYVESGQPQRIWL